MSSLLELIKVVKVECTKAYKSGVNFVISNLKTQAEKLKLIVPYFTLMRDFQRNNSKASPSITLLPSPHAEETIQMSQAE